jgi:hypothetical protein
MAQPVIHLGMVHYFAINKSSKTIEHRKIVADTEVKVRRPRYNHVVFRAPKVMQPINTAQPQPPPESTVDKIMKQLTDFF